MAECLCGVVVLNEVLFCRGKKRTNNQFDFLLGKEWVVHSTQQVFYPPHISNANLSYLHSSQSWNLSSNTSELSLCNTNYKPTIEIIYSLNVVRTTFWFPNCSQKNKPSYYYYSCYKKQAEHFGNHMKAPKLSHRYFQHVRSLSDNHSSIAFTCFAMVASSHILLKLVALNM